MKINEKETEVKQLPPLPLLAGALAVALLLGFFAGHSLSPYQFALWRADSLMAKKASSDKEKAAKIVEAQQAFRGEAVRTVRLEETRRAVAMALAEEYAQHEMWNESLKQLALANDILPGSYRGRYLEALARLNLALLSPAGDAARALLTDAENALRAAEKLNPDGGDVNYLAGRIYWERKNFAAAKERFLKVLSRFPDDSDTLFALARVYFDTGEYEKARDQYVKLESLLPRQSEKLATAEKNLSVLQDLLQNRKDGRK